MRNLFHRERMMAAAVVPVQEMVVATPSEIKRDRAPNGLADLKRKVTAYFSNPQSFVTPNANGATTDTAYDRYGDAREGWIAIKMPSLEEATGLVHLGNGCYSDVYAIPGDDARVIKIVKARGDKGYRRYVEAIGKLRGNPHVPVVYYSGNWGGRTVYILEKLTSRYASDDENAGAMVDAFETAVTMDIRNRRRGGESFANPFVTLSPAVAALSALCREKGWTDIGGENVMLRGNVPVLTDPASDGGES